MALNIKISDIKLAMVGKEKGFLQFMGVSTATLNGKHQKCPSCGGSDRFRWDNAKAIYHCGGGGNYTGGHWLDLLVHCNHGVPDIRKEAMEWLGLSNEMDTESREKYAAKHKAHKAKLMADSARKQENLISDDGILKEMEDLEWMFKDKERSVGSDEVEIARALVMKLIKRYKAYSTVK